MEKIRTALLLFGLGLILLFLDFWSKSYVYNVLSVMGGKAIFSNFLGGIDFAIHLVFNRGAAWGFLSEYQIPLLILRMAIVFLLLIYLLFAKHQKQTVLSLVLIIVGAIGNIADFFLYRSVVDFFMFTFWGWTFPLFNVADAMITVGVTLLVFPIFFGREKKREKVL